MSRRSASLSAVSSPTRVTLTGALSLASLGSFWTYILVPVAASIACVASGGGSKVFVEKVPPVGKAPPQALCDAAQGASSAPFAACCCLQADRRPCGRGRRAFWRCQSLQKSGARGLSVVTAPGRPARVDPASSRRTDLCLAEIAVLWDVREDRPRNGVVLPLLLICGLERPELGVG